MFNITDSDNVKVEPPKLLTVKSAGSAKKPGGRTHGKMTDW